MLRDSAQEGFEERDCDAGYARKEQNAVFHKAGEWSWNRNSRLPVVDAFRIFVACPPAAIRVIFQQIQVKMSDQRNPPKWRYRFFAVETRTRPETELMARVGFSRL